MNRCYQKKNNKKTAESNLFKETSFTSKIKTLQKQKELNLKCFTWFIFLVRGLCQFNSSINFPSRNIYKHDCVYLTIKH